MNKQTQQGGGKKQPVHPQQESGRQPGGPRGFEGMNFEEQRGSYKNSDFGGAKEHSKASRNGKNERNGDR